MVGALRTVRLGVPGSGNGRLSAMRLITIVEVMRWTPGKVASFEGGNGVGVLAVHRDVDEGFEAEADSGRVEDGSGSR